MLEVSRLGARVREIRVQCGFSQEAVAQALDLPRTAVTNMENGKRAITTLELTRLAEFFGCPIASFVPSDESPSAEQLCGVMLRALPEIRRSPGFGSSVRRLLGIYRDGASLRRLLDQKNPPAVIDRATAMDSEADAVLQGENAAREERSRLELGTAPIRNIAKIISDQGIWTVAIKLPRGLSGLFVNHSDVGMAILVNQGHRRSRRRFSYAHEYAHALFDQRETVAATRSKNSSKLMEVRANSFAAAFLMPPAGVAAHLAHSNKGFRIRSPQVVYDVANDQTLEREVRRPPEARAIAYQDVALLARHFGVSYEGVVWRLHRLNHVSASDRKLLMSQQKAGNELIRLIAPRVSPEEGTVQSDAWELELRGQLLALAIEAVRREKISMGRYLEICARLSVDVKLMEKLAHVARAE